MIQGYRTVAICVAEMVNEDIQDMIFPLHRYLEQNNWKTLIFNTCTDLLYDTAFDKGERCVFSLIPYDSVDAIVIYGRTIKRDDIIQDIVNRACAQCKPVIIVDCDTEFEGAINVSYEEDSAFRALVTHLIEVHKFTDINFIAGFKDNIVSERRKEIFLDVLEEHNISFDEERQLGYGNFYDIPTFDVMEKFLADPHGLPQAIVCANDSMAIAAIDYLNEHGYSIPEHVVVTGFDGILKEKYISPRITTCRRNMQHMAEYVGQLILDNICTRAIGKKRERFPLMFDCSESCGCHKIKDSHHNSTVGFLYAKTNDSVNHDRSMTNMITLMNAATTVAEMQGLLKHYIEYDTFLCMNLEMDTDMISHHVYNDNPFSREMQVYRYFGGHPVPVTSTKIPLGDLIPDWDIVWERSEPVVFMALHDQAECYGYMACLIEDSNYNRFMHFSQRMQRVAANLDTIISLHIKQQVMLRTNRRLQLMQDRIIASFADMVESRDDSTGQHIKRTQDYISILIRHALHNSNFAKELDEKKADIIIKAAPLHDIGKIKVSDTILNKPGRLTPEEFSIMQRHCIEGGRIIEESLNEIEDSEYIEIARNVAIHHHEKWDGSGYPSKLKGKDIPICARLMAIVDVFDALSSKRVYKEAYSLDETFSIMKESRGTHFDPELLDIFCSLRDEIVQCFIENSKAGSAFQRR